MAASKDQELEAIGKVVRALEALDEEVQQRVIDYVLTRFGISSSRGSIRHPTLTVSGQPILGAGEPRPRPPSDIRSLTDEKQPSSAIEMVAVAAYYISELAPEDERRDTINMSSVRKYFKQAGFRLPSRPEYTLPNAMGAGYFERAGRGEFRLNPVGYNLVVHGLPKAAAKGRTAPRKTATRKKSTRKKASRKKSTRR